MRLDFEYQVKDLSKVDKVFVYKETYSDFTECGFYAPVKRVESADGMKHFDTYLVDGVRWVSTKTGAMKEGVFTSKIIPPNDTILFASKDDFMLAVKDYVHSYVEFYDRCY